MSETKIVQHRNKTAIAASSENLKHAVELQLKIRALNRQLKQRSRHQIKVPVVIVGDKQKIALARFRNSS